METQSVEVFLVSGFHKGTLSIDLQTNRAMEISREAVSVFFHALLQPNNLFVQTLVVERIILLEVGNTKYLVSGQHRGGEYKRICYCINNTCYCSYAFAVASWYGASVDCSEQALFYKAC